MWESSKVLQEAEPCTTDSLVADPSNFTPRPRLRLQPNWNQKWGLELRVRIREGDKLWTLVSLASLATKDKKQRPSAALQPVLLGSLQEFSPAFCVAPCNEFDVPVVRKFPPRNQADR